MHLQTGLSAISGGNPVSCDKTPALLISAPDTSGAVDLPEKAAGISASVIPPGESDTDRPAGNAAPATRKAVVWVEIDRERIRARFGDHAAENSNLVGILSFKPTELDERGRAFGPRYLGSVYHAHTGDRKRFNVYTIGARRSKNVQTLKAAVKVGRKTLKKHGWEIAE